MIMVSRVLTQSQLVVFLDLLNEFGILSISDNNIKAHIGIYDEKEFVVKPIKSLISQLRKRVKPIEEITGAEKLDTLLDSNTKNQILTRDCIDAMLKHLKAIKGKD